MAAIETLSAPSKALRSVGHLMEDDVQNWSTMCGDFLAWEREHMILREASPEDRSEHRQSLKWLLRLTRLINSLVADPEFR
jgi:hypothetical protein